ncbi:MAG: hypothetical protein J6Y94_05810, partial [Bacteriovoracaceae bacterium]|nr:hypothetical protein [Bacteriovoracaceae bacterium]
MKIPCSLLQVCFLSLTLLLASCELGQKSDTEGESSAMQANPSPIRKSCGDVLDGASQNKQFYTVRQVYEGDSCDHYQITLSRTCHDGSFGEWEGTTSNFYETCKLDPSRKACTIKGGQPKESKRFYKAPTVAFDQQCESVTLTRICEKQADGQWVYPAWSANPHYATYPYSSCTVREPLSCNIAEHGQTVAVTYFTQRESSVGNPCVPFTTNATCWDGQLSYEPALPEAHYPTCGNSGASCEFEGKTYAHNAYVGEPRQRYKTPIGDQYRKCNASTNMEVQHRYCNNGKITEWDGTFAYSECHQIEKSDWKIVNTDALKINGENSLTFGQMVRGNSRDVYSCGGKVFLHLNSAGNEELFYFSPAPNINSPDQMQRLASDPTGKLNPEIFLTGEGHRQKKFAGFTCIDNQYLLFTVIYPDGNRLNEAPYREKIVAFKTSDNRLLVADEDIYDPAVSSNRGVLYSYLQSPFIWAKEKENYYEVVFNYQALSNYNISQLFSGHIRLNPQGISFEHYDNAEAWKRYLARPSTVYAYDDLKIENYRTPSTAFLKDAGFLRFYPNVFSGGHTPRQDQIDKNYAFEYCPINTNQCQVLTTLKIPAQYIMPSTPYQVSKTYTDYILAGVWGKLVGYQDRIYLFLESGDRRSILEIDLAQHLATQANDETVFQEVAFSDTKIPPANLDKLLSMVLGGQYFITPNEEALIYGEDQGAQSYIDFVTDPMKALEAIEDGMPPYQISYSKVGEIYPGTRDDGFHFMPNWDYMSY